jgi:hypothetical protein
MNKQGGSRLQLENDFLNSTFTPEMLRTKQLTNIVSPILGPFTQSPDPPMAPKFVSPKIVIKRGNITSPKHQAFQSMHNKVKQQNSILNQINFPRVEEEIDISNYQKHHDSFARHQYPSVLKGFGTTQPSSNALEVFE